MDKNKAAATSRRAKVVAMATQTASPNEAKVAKAMLAKSPEGQLDVIATDILSIAQRTIEDEFAIGRLLTEAASILNPMARTKGADGKQSGSAFTDWFNQQGFPFSMKTAHRLRIAVEREGEVRALIAGKVGRDMGVNTAVALLTSPGKPSAEAIPVTDATPVDPAYAALRQAHQLIVDGAAFSTMHVDDLTKSAGLIKGLATAYNEAKAARSA